VKTQTAAKSKTAPKPKNVPKKREQADVEASSKKKAKK